MADTRFVRMLYVETVAAGAVDPGFVTELPTTIVAIGNTLNPIAEFWAGLRAFGCDSTVDGEWVIVTEVQDPGEL